MPSATQTTFLSLPVVAEPTDPQQAAVLRLLREGRSWSRPELVQWTGLSDRMVREVVRELRLAGHPIRSSSHSAGYALAQTADELAHFEADCRSRALSLLALADATARSRDALLLVEVAA